MNCLGVYRQVMAFPLFIFSKAGCSECRAGDGHWACVRYPSQPPDRFLVCSRFRPVGLKLKWGGKELFWFQIKIQNCLLDDARMPLKGTGAGVYIEVEITPSWSAHPVSA